ncbi:glycosyltransferase [Asanoa sp. NPDC049573]|uniref:glycosyltransferase n=1 Tax=Asanoa sp. NPDC049573 TaxID=3155396 RepID=UPI0034436826
MLSVVVPVHNVLRYLDICLESLAGQTYRDLDVVLVDDGSTDGSGAVAAAWVARDPRFRLVSQANAGLGAARNAGAAVARGEYLAFVDADDVLPSYAFEVLVGALEKTGSDFATGDVRLLTDGVLTPSPLHRGTHRETRLAVDPRTARYLVYDRLACNKVWRRSFWGETRFPEGVHYEDIPVTVPLYGRARAVDVVGLPVYYWRQRPPGDPSISQRLAEQRNLEDRFAAVSTARRELPPDLATWYAETALQSDLRLVLEVLPDVDEAYRARFRKLASAFVADIDPGVLDRLPGRLATAWRLALGDDLDRLVALVRDVHASGLAGMAAWRDPAHPVSVTEVRWSGDDRLRLRVAGARSPLSMLWLHQGGAPHRVVATAVSGTASLHASRLAPGEWTVNIAPPRMLVRVTDPPPPLPSRWIDPATRVTPLARGGVLRLLVDRPTVYATVARQDGTDLCVEGVGRLEPDVLLHLELAPGIPSRSYPVVPAGDRWSVRLPLADLAAPPLALPAEPPAVWRAALGASSDPLLGGPDFTGAVIGAVVVAADARGVLTIT